MILRVFCQTNGDQAQQPGSTSTTVRLVAIPGAQGPNAEHFQNGLGNGFIELQNVSADVKAALAAGGIFEVEITPYVPPA